MQIKYETLGDVIKSARIKADITVEALAEKVGVSDRYIYRIENEGKKPSFDVLYKLIRELSIIPDQMNIPPQTGQQNGGNRSRVTVEMSPGVRLQVQAVE